MIAYFDTSVLILIHDQGHENYAKATQILGDVLMSGKACSTTFHAFAEMYNTLTRRGGNWPAVPPEEVEKMLFFGVDKRLELIELTRSDYKAAIGRCRQLDLTGSVIYNALHYQAALKAGAEVLYTDNLKDFRRLQLPEDTLEIKGSR